MGELTRVASTKDIAPGQAVAVEAQGQRIAVPSGWSVVTGQNRRLDRNVRLAWRTIRVWMFYSNRRPEDAAFLQQLTQLQIENPNFKLVETMTNVGDSLQPWQGGIGCIDKQMLSKYLGALTGRVYYIAGPPAMVNSMTKLLSDAGLKPAEIRSEEFIGY